MKYIVYTDGAYSQMNDEGAYAFVILTELNNEVKRFAEKITHETNNRAELKAIINAILQLPQDAKDVIVYSDSQYALNTLSGKWKRKLNKDLFLIWDDVTKERGLDIEYNWVKGHNGNEYNELCDKLCNDAIGYDANAETNVFRKDKELEETVTISKERYEFLLRCEEFVNNNKLKDYEETDI